MEVERWGGSGYSRHYNDRKKLLEDLEKALDDPKTRKITIKPALRIPGKRGRK